MGVMGTVDIWTYSSVGLFSLIHFDSSEKVCTVKKCHSHACSIAPHWGNFWICTHANGCVLVQWLALLTHYIKVPGSSSFKHKLIRTISQSKLSIGVNMFLNSCFSQHVSPVEDRRPVGRVTHPALCVTHTMIQPAPYRWVSGYMLEIL